MDGNLNTGRWKAMENGFADALAAGKTVDLRIDVVYDGASGRPQGFTVNSIVDGVEQTRTFFNRAGG